VDEGGEHYRDKERLLSDVSDQLRLAYRIRVATMTGKTTPEPWLDYAAALIVLNRWRGKDPEERSPANTPTALRSSMPPRRLVGCRLANPNVTTGGG
jgi:hypothetical protein